jgi:hypothetical protein
LRFQRAEQQAPGLAPELELELELELEQVPVPVPEPEQNGPLR